MPSKNTTIKHLTGTLSSDGPSKLLSLSHAELHRVLDEQARTIYDHSANKQRDERRSLRLKKEYARQKRRARVRPKPLSAKQRRQFGIDEIPEAERKWEMYEPLRVLWTGYMREILGLSSGSDGKMGRSSFVTPQGAGPIIASADMHGAVVECVRSRCVSRVGVRGVVVQDRKFIFVIMTEKNEVKKLPKEHSIFRIKVPIDPTSEDDEKELVFEIHGEQFQNRAPDRSKKQFKQHYNPDL